MERCKGCDELKKRIEELRTTLKVIHTWASYVADDGKRPAFKSEQIADKCWLSLMKDY